MCVGWVGDSVSEWVGGSVSTREIAETRKVCEARRKGDNACTTWKTRHDPNTRRPEI